MKEPEPPAYTRMRHSSEGMSCRLPCMKDSTSSNLLDEELPLGLLMTNGLKRIVRWRVELSEQSVIKNARTKIGNIKGEEIIEKLVQEVK